MIKSIALALLLTLGGGFAPTRSTAAPPAPDIASTVDRIAHDVLEATGVPSASVAVVQDGAIAYRHAYGDARLDPPLPATPEMRYSIGSISKQFTAAAILLLQEQGRLTLDDPVGKWVPGLTRGDDVTIREILSHTSGYQDFWPQDYLPPLMLKAITPDGILARWARKPLDFDPGTRWQYSNTNFVIAGLIVQKAAGMPLWQFLDRHVFAPLGMKSVTNTDEHALPSTDPAGYFRYALGPARPAPKEGPGWMFAAGELAMTPADLAKWNISIIRRSILKPESYAELETEVGLKNGLGTSYALGVHVADISGHRELEHSGEVSGFTAENIVLPDEGLAVTVLTNQDAASAAAQIGDRVRDALLEQTTPRDEQRAALARKVFEELRQGRIDRSLFTANANAYFSEQALRDYADGLRPLGTITGLTPIATRERGGMTYRGFEVKFRAKIVVLSIYEMPDGRYEQFLVEPRG
ncbi:MAG: serine hydrolase domain-containing protein [Betaproteobacteria bacterium]